MTYILYLILNIELLQVVQECKVCHLELEEVDQISKEVTFSVVMVLQWVHQAVAPWAQRDKTCANVKTLTQKPMYLFKYLFLYFMEPKMQQGFYLLSSTTNFSSSKLYHYY